MLVKRNFRVGDLFFKADLKKKKGFNKRLDTSVVRTKEFELPLVNAKDGNNGIMYYGRKKDFEFDNLCLDIVQNGAVATGNVYVQEECTGVLWDAYLIKPYKQVNKYVLLYIATLLRKILKSTFCYDDKAIWDKVKNIEIPLPINSNGEINYNYMETYMKETENKAKIRIQKIAKLFSDVSSKIDVSTWKEFNLDSLFEIVKGSRLRKQDMKEGGYNYIGASSFNNGITNQIGNKENLHPASTITVSYNGSVGQAFYQSSPYWASDDVNIFYPKFKTTKNILMFFLPLIKSIGKNFEFTDKWKIDEMRSAIIKLPVDSLGNPDWKYMEHYMSNIESMVKTRLETLSINKA